MPRIKTIYDYISKRKEEQDEKKKLYYIANDNVNSVNF